MSLSNPVARPERHAQWLWITSVLLAVLTGMLYVRTLHPGVGPYLDSIQYQITTLMLGVSHPPGYPLYTWLGAMFVHGLPFGNPALRLNLLSVVGSVVTVLLVQRVTYRLTHSLTAATLGALFLALSVRFWYQASYTELYPVYNAILAATWLALLVFMETGRQGAYFLAVLLYALAFGVNVPAIMLLPMWLWAVFTTDHRMVLRPRNLVIAGAIVMGVALQYLWIPARAFAATPAAFCNFCPTDWQGVIDFWRGKRWWHISFGLPPQYWLQRWADSGYQLSLQFWPIGMMLGGVGIMALLRKRFRMAITGLLGLAGTWIFVATYAVVDWDDFLTPVYVFFAPLIAVGLQAAWEALREGLRTWDRRWVPVVRGLGLALVAGFLILVMRNNYPIADQSHKTEWHGWARDLLPQFEEGAWLLTPPTATDGFVQTWVLRYISWAEDLRPEMTVVYVPDASFEPPGPAPYYLTWAEAEPYLRDHPVYLIELNDPRIEGWVLQPVTRYDGWVIGYRIVGERVRNGDGQVEIVPWVDEAAWLAMRDNVIAP
jgi:hypothetical protein